jgi:hypothetical protein
MASLLDFLNPNGQPRGLLGNFQPQQKQAAPDQGGGFGAGVSNFLSNNPLMLMALGGGIAQGGIGRGLTTAVPAAQYEQQQQKQQQAQGATYQALRAAGVPQNQAIAGALNSDVLKTIARFHLNAKPTFSIVGHDETGKPTYGFINEWERSVEPLKQSMSVPHVPELGGENVLRERGPAQNLSSLEGAISRLGILTERLNKFDNLGNVTQEATTTSLKPAVTGLTAQNFALIRGTAASEMANILGASGVTGEEIRGWKDELNKSSTVKDLRATIGRGIELVNSRLTTSQPPSGRATVPTAPQSLSSRSRGTLEKIRE